MEKSGKIVLSGIQDHRDDPEGVIFEDPDSEKAKMIDRRFTTHCRDRMKGLGYAIQPVGAQKDRLTAICEQVAYGFTGETIKNMKTPLTGKQMNDWWVKALTDILEA